MKDDWTRYMLGEWGVPEAPNPLLGLRLPPPRWVTVPVPFAGAPRSPAIATSAPDLGADDPDQRGAPKTRENGA